MPKYASEISHVALVLDHGTPGQRALRVVRLDRADHVERAVRLARSKHGATAALAWVNTQTGEVVAA